MSEKFEIKAKKIIIFMSLVSLIKILFSLPLGFYIKLKQILPIY